MVDIAADAGWLHTALGAMHLTQMVSQGRFLDAPQIAHLPGIDESAEEALAKQGIRYLPQLIHTSEKSLRAILSKHLSERALAELFSLLASLPATRLSLSAPAHVEPGAECALSVCVEATNTRARRNAHAPGFTLTRRGGGWWLVMAQGDELFALKRVSVPARFAAILYIYIYIYMRRLLR